ncbi:MAG: TIGR01212 family radical SAM protein [Thermoanaerobaculaceae bacterium]|nr:TIGR01212 family radical SAM protein [Thermoanaerobaculaceae bacterium]
MIELKVNEKNGLPYYNLSSFLKEHFGGKVRKISIDAGFSCPNRKGKEREGGCFWCDPKGSGSGNDPKLWRQKLEEETKRLLQKGFKGSIAYFQSFSNTYREVKELNEFYRAALEINGVLGLAIGTRADCLNDENIELLSHLSKEKFLWVEIGMQTKNDKTLELCNRGYSHSITVEAVYKLKGKNIKTVLHLIAGLPGETEEIIFESFEECSKLMPWGVKLHPLHIVKGSFFEKWFYDGKIKLLELNQYANIAATFIEMMPPETVIHRITGEREEGILIAPKWCLDKNNVRNEIVKILKERNSFQGKLFKQRYG